VTYIEQYAFYGCDNLTDVYCFVENVPAASLAFDKDLVSAATLHVPEASIEDYKQKSPWNWFANIVALTEEETGLSAIDNGELKIDKVYDFSGRKLSKMQRGINIIRMKDGTTKKVLVK